MSKVLTEDMAKAIELIEGKRYATEEVMLFFKNKSSPFVKELGKLANKKSVDGLALTTTVIVNIFGCLNYKNKILLLRSVLDSLSNEAEIKQKVILAKDLEKRLKAEREGRKQ